MIADPLVEAREAAHTAYLTATVQGEHDDATPITHEEKLDAALEVFLTVLRTAGWVAAPHTRPTGDELDAAAIWLAEQSAFVRYWKGRRPDGTPASEGWRKLREHPTDVRTAYAKAASQPGAELIAPALQTTMKLLLAHVEQDIGRI